MPEEGSPAPVASGDNEEASGAETADTPTTGRVKRKAVKRKASLDKKKGLESSSDAQCTDPAEPKRTVKVCWLYELLPVELQAEIASYLAPREVLKIWSGRQDYLSLLSYRHSFGYRPHANVLDKNLRERVVKVLDLVVEGREPSTADPYLREDTTERLPRGRLSTFVARDFFPADPEVLSFGQMESRMCHTPLYPRIGEHINGSAAEERVRFETLLSYVAGRDLDHSIMVKFCPQLTLEIREAWEPEYDYADEHPPQSYNRELRWHYSSLDGHKAGKLRIDIDVGQTEAENYLTIALLPDLGMFRPLTNDERELRKGYDMEFLSALEFILGLQDAPYAKFRITEARGLVKDNVKVCRRLYKFGLDLSE